MSLNTSPRTWVAGEIVTAAEMNTEIRDAVTGIQAAWTSYTPVWTSTGTAPAIVNGTLAGRYTRTGKTVTFLIQMVVGSSTTVGTGTYSWSLPPVTSIQSTHTAVAGGANFFDSSAGTDFSGWGVVLSSTTTVTLRSNAGSGVSATNPVVPASGDIVTISGTYEAV